jgi:hypothetical protein
MARRLKNPKHLKPMSDEEASSKGVRDIRKRTQGRLAPLKLSYGPAYAEPYHPKSEPIKRNIDKAPLENDTIPGPIRSFKRGG